MEILTYVLEGTVEHQDSMGNKEQVPAGEFQITSAGTGIRHQSTTQAAPSVCICIRSGSCLKKTVLRRVIEQRRFDAVQGKQLVLSPDARDGSLESASGYGTVSLGAGER